MSEETLNRLFEQARNERPETNLGEIQKWIGLGGAGLFAAGLLTKLKLLVTLKPFIMITSAIVTIGIGASAVLMMNSSKESQQRVSPSQAQTTKTHQKTEVKPNDQIIATTTFHQPETEAVTLPPLTHFINSWNSAGEIPPPSLQYCLSTPVAPPMRNLPVDGQYCLSIPLEGQTDYGVFNALKLSGGVEVVLIQGKEYDVRIEGDEKDKECVVVKNNNKTLEVYLDCKGRSNSKIELKVFVTMENLDKINCSGACNLNTEGEIKFSNLEMIITGASDIVMDMTVTNLKMTTSGASDITLNGTADKMELISSGATEIDAEGLKVKTGVIDCSGASEMSIYVSDNLDIKVSGASEIEYSGSPVISKQSVTGASTLKKK